MFDRVSMEPFAIKWLRWHLYRKQKNNPRRSALWAFDRAVHQLRPDDVAIDCGANKGDVSAYLLQRSSCVMHAFEPDPTAYKKLQNRLGDQPRVHLHNAAVGIEAGQVRLYRMEATASSFKATECSSLFNYTDELDGEPIEVRTVDLAEFIRRIDAPIGLMTLDVEGAEFSIVRHLIETGLITRIKSTFVETHERFFPDGDQQLFEIESELKKRGIGSVFLNWE